MKVVVCVKQVNGELNPFDASALEYALQLYGAEVTLLSMGRLEVKNMLLGLTRLGALKGVLLSDTAFAGSDTLATAYVLSLAIKRMNPDLILCGRQSIDGDTAQVGPSLATMLNIPVITNAVTVDSDGQLVDCTTRQGQEQAELPALVTTERGVNLRFPKLRSKIEEVELWSADDIGADRTRCGLYGSPTRVLKTNESTSGMRKCTFISPDELSLVIEKSLKKPRHSVALNPLASVPKLPEVWMIGDHVPQIAKSVAHNVRLITLKNSVEIAALANKETPPVILWDSGLWGRKTAPQVAALLNTGLCADCTMLETDGKQLYMYRPARSGSIMAKIICKTLPQMATVRMCEQTGSNVLVSAGLGAANHLSALTEWANKHSFSMGASRALVDKGLLPYEYQIGQTGRTVSPVIYLACGISGAVQHTCATEQAGTIIAVNSDKNARIFDYADYGIVADCKDIIQKILV